MSFFWPQNIRLLFYRFQIFYIKKPFDISIVDLVHIEFWLFLSYCIVNRLEYISPYHTWRIIFDYLHNWHIIASLIALFLLASQQRFLFVCFQCIRFESLGFYNVYRFMIINRMRCKRSFTKQRLVFVDHRNKTKGKHSCSTVYVVYIHSNK